MPIKILIADDHPLIAEGIKNTFENQLDFEVVSVVNNGQEAIEFIQQHLVDIALLDINMPVMDGIECAKKIISGFKDVKVAMLSMYQEPSIIKNLIEIGVKGYMLKTIPSDELLLAIKNIYNGKEYFNADVTKALITDDSSSTFIKYSKKSPLLEELTSREKEIVKFISQGLTNAQIGEKLFISPRTVDTHRTNVMKKLDIHNVASLIRFAFKNGLAS
ncbi:LuxR family two component transcriptional regulator [Lutibacter sp. Hel_I_33_5]|uniref:response regulator n=1 Tax=Lutibacter sp. Hel_I_33_5 TaxID=1566289 RepID=UPI00119ED1C3|nr:response regulator transcription factor [Lutibacter sp. Hel_I_33_5]TVZ56145.1 LuxR family two component transcriptional regulator [Lutibacter sp. Hel_I_33_5]